MFKVTIARTATTNGFRVFAVAAVPLIGIFSATRLLSLSLGPKSSERAPRLARDDDVLAGGEDPDADGGGGVRDLGVRGRPHVRVLVEPEAEEGKAVADRTAHARRALADAGGEHEGVKAVERRSHGRDRPSDAVCVDGERRSARLAGALDVADVAAGARDGAEPRLEVERVVELVRRQAPLP